MAINIAGAMALFIKISKAIAGQIKIAKAAINRAPLLGEWGKTLKDHTTFANIANLWQVAANAATLLQRPRV
ncbi:hypothetical protein [Yoonia sp. R78084]|uniref:hypothetical protein n=1 Tax=Yoonia sp. R78084 TaxID=3093869 RepID=UPI0037DDBE9F